MRPLYETPTHLAAEDRIRAAVERAWNCQAVKLRVEGLDGSLDFQLIKPARGPAFAELKHRNNSLDHYPTFMISMKKVRAAERHKREFDAPSFMVIEFIDQIYWAPFHAPYSIADGGRWDRNDPYDVESCAFFAIEHFRLLL